MKGVSFMIVFGGFLKEGTACYCKDGGLLIFYAGRFLNLFINNHCL